MSCPTCAATLPEGARFCPSCGQALRHQGDERRVVTVVFGDLVGFTALSEVRDPEQVKNLVDRCFERLVADITSYGGRVDKIVGDAIVALFGAPVAHEDDAERAVRAALQMQRSLAERVGGEADVQMRIGVNTGEVLVGALRAGGDYTAMGDVVNTAQRLQTAAAPGQVLVGPETHHVTREVVRYESVGRLLARGREEPVDAWAAQEPVAPPGQRPRRARTPLVGRDAEVGVLTHALDTAVTHGRPHLVLLVGEAGLGKSRLAEEVAGVALSRHKALVLEGRAVPYGEANPWWPLAEALRQSCSIEPGDTLEEARDKCRAAVAVALERRDDDHEVERVADGLLYLMGQAGPLGEVDVSRAREEAAWAVRSYLEALAVHRPVVVVLSDLQWANQLVLDLLDGLLERLRRLPVVVLTTARPEVEERWQPPSGRHNLLVVNLDPLDQQAVARLVASLLEHEPDHDLLDVLHERSGGNPFFLEELVALLNESGVLGEPQRPTDAGRRVRTLPDTLRGLVAARLDALPADERSLLEDAAVLGRRGSLAALRALSSARHADDVRPLVESLAARDLLELVDERVGFRSDLIREVAYSTLTKGERARRHAAVAAWLTERGGSVETAEQGEMRAHHLAAAAEQVAELGAIEGVAPDIAEQALDALLAGAEAADESENHLIALHLYERGLRLLDGERSERWRRFLLGRVGALTGIGEMDRARPALDEALAEAERADDREGVATALTILGDVERLEGRPLVSQETFRRAVEAWRQLGDRRGEAGALRRAGLTDLFAGDLQAAEHEVSDALDAFRELGDRRGEGWALHHLARIAFVRGDAEAADERLAASVAMFRETGDWGGIGQAQGLQAWVRYFQGRRAEAERLVADTLPEARERGDRSSHGIMSVLLAWLRLWSGRADEAVELARQAHAMFQEIGYQWGEGMALGPLARGLLAAGDAAGARELVGSIKAAAPMLTGARSQTTVSVLPAAVAVQLGQPEQALAELRDAGEAMPDSIDAVERLVLHALALTQLGRAAEAVAELGPVADQRDPGGFALSTLAMAMAAAGRPAEATATAERVGDLDDATYLDRTVALVAAGCAAAQRGDANGADRAFTRAAQLIDGTDDRLTQAIVRLCWGRAFEALGAPGTTALLDDAQRRLQFMGVDGDGWDTAFLAAVGASPAAPAAAGC